MPENGLSEQTVSDIPLVPKYIDTVELNLIKPDLFLQNDTHEYQRGYAIYHFSIESATRDVIITDCSEANFPCKEESHCESAHLQKWEFIDQNHICLDDRFLI